MALGVPSLDQLGSIQIDSLSIQLDDDTEFEKLEFSNPTLDQLDSWGLLDNLDTFGNFDSLSSLEVKQADGTIATSSAVSSASIRIRSAVSSVSASASVSSSANRVQLVGSSIDAV